ncbi:hypothetical protein DFH07DRAFT_971364 [Mycena maculata]|uniref:Uncharacterized protein n=1 Tax=Mycena maculata TaxID=230809 RepID=A0AAD7HMY7_9AGAR|nr:hypothetical protein DFH07DRAFT_971364 [Mycena maculata]
MSARKKTARKASSRRVVKSSEFINHESDGHGGTIDHAFDSSDLSDAPNEAGSTVTLDRTSADADDTMGGYVFRFKSRLFKNQYSFIVPDGTHEEEVHNGGNVPMNGSPSQRDDPIEVEDPRTPDKTTRRRLARRISDSGDNDAAALDSSLAHDDSMFTRGSAVKAGLLPSPLTTRSTAGRKSKALLTNVDSDGEIEITNGPNAQTSAATKRSQIQETNSSSDVETVQKPPKKKKRVTSPSISSTGVSTSGQVDLTVFMQHLLDKQAPLIAANVLDKIMPALSKSIQETLAGGQVASVERGKARSGQSSILLDPSPLGNPTNLQEALQMPVDAAFASLSNEGDPDEARSATSEEHKKQVSNF